MSYIAKALRAFVFERANGLCEYCQTPAAIVIEMEVDHIRPVSDDGDTDEANLCLCCASCNMHKGDAVEAVDPETGDIVSLFHPRQDRWNEHFAWNTDGQQLRGLTPVGRATIARLKINRDIAMQARQRWVTAGWHPPATSTAQSAPED